MTPRDRLAAAYAAARDRATAAAYQGDATGAAIARADARRLLARLAADR